MSQPNGPSNPHVEALRDLCFFPSLTLIVFTRRRLGLRLLKPIWIVRTFILLQLYAMFGVALMNGKLIDVRLIQWFSLAFLIAASVQYWRSWREFNRGIRLHTFSSGISYLEKCKVPRFLRTHRRIYRLLEPLISLVGACSILALSPSFGLWLVVSSFSLRYFEQARYESALDRDLDIVDGLTEADVQQRTVEFFSGGDGHARTGTGRSLSQQGGIPTGVAHDIEPQIAARRRGGKQKP